MKISNLSNTDSLNLNKVSIQNGYENVDIPTLTNFNNYVLFEDYIKRKMVKFVDTDGSVQVLNFDCTLSLAQIYSKLDSETRPNQMVSYMSKSTIMNQNRIMEERLIWGGENYGDDVSQVDVDIISFGIESLLALGLEDFTVDIGSINYIKNMVSELNLESYDDILRLIEEKNVSELKSYLKSTKASQVIQSKILKIPSIFGDFKMSIESAKNITLNQASSQSLYQLELIYNQLKEKGYGKYINLDIGFTNSYQYYSGLIFKGYLDNVGKTVLQGGRYDKLMNTLGSSTRACGFSIDLTTIGEVKANDQYWCQQRKSS